MRKKKQQTDAVKLFLATEVSEWHGLSDTIANEMTKYALEAVKECMESTAMDIVDELSEDGLEYEALISAFNEFYHAATLLSPVIKSYNNPLPSGLSVLDVISMKSLAIFATLYDYELQDDLMTIFIDIYNIFQGDEQDLSPITNLNRIIVELYNNNASREIPEDDMFIDLFKAPVIFTQLNELVLSWEHLNDLYTLKMS